MPFGDRRPSYLLGGMGVCLKDSNFNRYGLMNEKSSSPIVLYVSVKNGTGGSHIPKAQDFLKDQPIVTFQGYFDTI